MPATTFKLSKRDGLTRRVTFPSRPDWPALAAKISSLYGIPADKIGVSYVDNEGDEVTLSTQEELNDFYQTSFKPKQASKFTVYDFRAPQVDSDKTLPDTPRSSTARHTFGTDGLAFVDIGEDWQPLHSAGLFNIPKPMPRPDSPHAFVEILESDTSSITKDNDSDDEAATLSTPHPQTGGFVHSAHSSAPSSRPSTAKLNVDKGKGRAQSVDMNDEVSSTASVLANDAPVKPPVHVYDISGQDAANTVFPDLSRIGEGPQSVRGTVTPVQAESTPKVVAQALNDKSTTNDAMDETPDPPLPSLEAPSISNDVATLLNTFQSVFASHPELSEGVRNIIQNAANGRYWAAHRDAITHAANELVRTAENTSRLAEEEAGRRIAEAIGGMVRSLTQVTAGTDANAQTSVDSSAQAAAAPVATQPTTSQGPSRPWRQPPSWAVFNGATKWSEVVPPWGYRGPPPPPPPMPPPMPIFGYRHHHPWHTDGPFGQDHHDHFMPPPPPVHGMPPPPGDPSVTSPVDGWHPQPGPQPPNWGAIWSSDSVPSPQELRAQVEAAKMYYKQEKERYRQQREERRKERERKHLTNQSNTVDATTANPIVPVAAPANPPAVPPPAEPPVSQIISNARGSYPQLEMYSVPRRANTHPGHVGPPSRRDVPGQRTDAMIARDISRVSKRLADMGFTENSYPGLAGKIKTHLPTKDPMTKDAEDEIVTTLLEELLAMSPKPPVASGSNIPGAWH